MAAAHQGTTRRPMDRRLLFKRSMSETGDAPRLRPARLSIRERQVLELVCAAHTTREIAAQLGIAPKTVEYHRGRLTAKSGTHSAADLLQWALRNGMIGKGKSAGA